MKVLMISELYHPVAGGLEGHVAELSRALIARGHQVSVATCAPGDDWHDGVRVHRLDSVTGRMNVRAGASGLPFQSPLPDPVAAAGLARVIHQEDPDLLHGHNWLTVSAVARRGRPLVVTLHDYGTICARRDLLRNDSAICAGPSLLRCGRCAPRHYGAVRGLALAASTPLGRRMLRPSAVVAVSEAVARRLDGRFPVEVEVIPNFVPDTGLTGEPLPDGLPDPGYVMFAGVAARHKGLAALMALWAEGMPAPLLMACPNPQDVPPVSGVHAVRLSRSQVQLAWRRAAVAVVPSIWAEPCATVVLEALQAGLPIVATAVGGTPELVRDGVEAVLVPPGDTDALGGALRSLLDQPDRRTAMGLAALDRSVAFRASVVVPQIEAVYRRVSHSE